MAIFFKVFDTLNLTLGTPSEAILTTVGNICLAVASGPQTSDRTYKRRKNIVSSDECLLQVQWEILVRSYIII